MFLIDNILKYEVADRKKVLDFFGYFLENENVKIKVASLDGKIIDIKAIEELASLGSFDDVRARFIGVLRAPGSQLARTLIAYKEKLEA